MSNMVLRDATASKKYSNISQQVTKRLKLSRVQNFHIKIHDTYLLQRERLQGGQTRVKTVKMCASPLKGRQ